MIFSSHWKPEKREREKQRPVFYSDITDNVSDGQLAFFFSGVLSNDCIHISVRKTNSRRRGREREGKSVGYHR
jgi:hypothetical protein